MKKLKVKSISVIINDDKAMERALLKRNKLEMEGYIMVGWNRVARVISGKLVEIFTSIHLLTPDNLKSKTEG